MRFSRFLPILFSTLTIALSLGAFWKPGRSAPLSLPSPNVYWDTLKEAPADAAATNALAQSIQKFTHPAHGWLQASVSIRSHVPGLRFQGEGVYLKTPDQRYRLEVRTRAELDEKKGRCTGTFLAIGDGRDRWQAMRTNTARYQEVKKLTPGEKSQPGEMLAGIDHLLVNLQATLTWVRVEQHASNVILTGVWHSTWQSQLAPNKQTWPANLPRICRLTLSGADAWPGRLEWWGPVTPGGDDVLLVEMEYRDPQWGRSLEEEQCARLFTFDPGKTRVMDMSEVK